MYSDKIDFFNNEIKLCKANLACLLEQIQIYEISICDYVDGKKKLLFELNHLEKSYMHSLEEFYIASTKNIYNIRKVG